MGKKILDILCVLVIILILVAAALFSISYFTTDKSENLTGVDDRAVLMEYSYIVLDKYFGLSNEDYVDVNQSLGDFEFDYHRLFLTIICNGSIRGCQSGSADSDDTNRLFLDVEEAIVECIEDDRFGGVMVEAEVADAEVVFTFLYNKQKLESNKLNFLKDNIELGIHAIEVGKDGKSAYFKESVPISKNYDLGYTLKRLCKKAGLDDYDWRDSDTSIYKYDTITFLGDRQGDIFDLYRYNLLVDVDDLTNEYIKNSLSLGQQWFLNSINNETGLLEYEYHPSSDSYSDDNNDVRQIASLWSMTELDLFFETNLFDELVNTTLGYYLSFKEMNGSYSYLTIDGYSKLAYNAFMILVLVNAQNYPNKDALLAEFADGILSLQNADGSYNTYFNYNSDSGKDFYPGEAMLALMKLYQSSGGEKYLNSVQNAFPYYRSYWRNTTNTAFVPWHSQVYWLLYRETEDSELAEFVFEMSDWIIDTYQITENEYIDLIGGFSQSNSPGSSTSSYMEGLNDAYSMAVAVNDEARIGKYKNVLRLGARFILQNQFNEDNTFYLENSTNAIGGFKKSLTNNYLRNDCTQHAVMALMKVYNNNVFN